MSRFVLAVSLAAALAACCSALHAAGQIPYGKGMTDANKERLVLDDLEDVSDWSAGTPVETTVSASDRQMKQGHYALLFANRIDHTQGETNYPVGWPRARKDMAKARMSDWSGWDFFECWIYVESSRSSLPSAPLSIGFYHSGKKRSSQAPLGQVQLGRWVKIVIPLASIAERTDVQAVQFSISESEYRHGDRVDFYIDDMVLTRIVQPTITEFGLDRKVLFSGDRTLTGAYRVMGSKNLDRVKVELEIGRGERVAAESAAPISPQGEISLTTPDRLGPGNHWARLNLRDAQGKLIDQKELPLRVIEGPF